MVEKGHANAYVSGYSNLMTLILNQDAERAANALTDYHSQRIEMFYSLLEMCLELPQVLAALQGSDLERDTTPGVIASFREDLQLIAAEHEGCAEIRRTIENASALFSYQNLKPPGADAFRRAIVAGESHLGDRLCRHLFEHFVSMQTMLKGNLFGNCKDEFERYQRNIVVIHDILIAFISAYPTYIAATVGEDLGQRVQNEAIKNFPGWQSMWEAARNLSAAEWAAMLVNLLDLHCSGEMRNGEVTVVEDDEKIHVIMNPCGSGGVLRRRQHNKLIKLKSATEFTWGRANEVPVYCSHCALNELRSIQLLGYPKMTTEFNPDPDKPCNWIVYKDPEAVPEDVFLRMGQSTSDTDNQS